MGDENGPSLENLVRENQILQGKVTLLKNEKLEKLLDAPEYAGDPSFDPVLDAMKLRKAMRGMGTDEKALIEVLCNRNLYQRMVIANTYSTIYPDRVLSDDLDSETSGDFGRTIVQLATHPALNDARNLRQSMKGLGTNDSTLIDIICTRNSRELYVIKKVYRNTFMRELEDDIRGDTSGDYLRFLCALIRTNGREKEGEVNLERVASDVELLYKAGEDKIGTNEGIFIAILACRSYRHINQVVRVYGEKHKDFIKVLESELSGNFEKACKSVVSFAADPNAYQASLLHKSMKGLGTKDEMLVRLLVTASNRRQIAAVREMYHAQTGKELAKAVASETSGDYKKALVALVNANYSMN